MRMVRALDAAAARALGVTLGVIVDGVKRWGETVMTLVAACALLGCKRTNPPAPAATASASASSSAVQIDDDDDAGLAVPLAPSADASSPPSSEALATMRQKFHEAAGLETSDPAKAIALYERSWTSAPTIAAMLGEARAAQAKGDGALARRCLVRARKLAQSGEKPRVAVTVSANDQTPKILDVESDAAFVVFDAHGPLLVRQDLATGALVPIVDFPDGSTVHAASPHLAVATVAYAGPSVLALGVDDSTTARPLDELPVVRSATISRDESLVGVTTDTGAAVIDARTWKIIGQSAITSPVRAVGFTRSGKRLVVLGSDGVCVLSAPSWNACAIAPALHVASMRDIAAIGGELVAFASDDQHFRIFDTEVNKTIVTLTGHLASVGDLAFTPDGATLLSTSFSRTVAWDVATHARQQLDTDYYGFSPIFSADGKRMVEATTNAVLVRDASALSVWMPIVAGGSYPISSAPPVVTFAPSGNLWVGGNRLVAHLDLRAGTIRSYPVYGATTQLAVSPDEKTFGLVDQFGNMGSNIYAYDASGKRLSKNEGGNMTSSLHFEGDKLVLHSMMQGMSIDVATGKSTTVPLSDAGADERDVSPDKKLKAEVDASRVVRVNGVELDIGADAFVATKSGKSQVFGNRASARCNVGSRWLPLEACDALLGSVSF